MTVVRHLGPLVAVALAAALTAACSHGEKLRCESNERYASSRTVPPLRIPEGLTVPDETDVLRIPDPSGAEPELSDQDLGCIESPPDFDSGSAGE